MKLRGKREKSFYTKLTVASHRLNHPPLDKHAIKTPIQNPIKPVINHAGFFILLWRTNPDYHDVSN